MPRRLWVSLSVVLALILIVSGITLAASLPVIYVNGRLLSNASVIMKDGTTYVPLRMVAESLNATVDYQNGKIYIAMAPVADKATQDEIQALKQQVQNLQTQIQRAGGLDVVSLVQKVGPSVVAIRGWGTDETGAEGYFGGTGIIVNASGLILTNRHVIEPMKQIKVFLADGRQFTAQVQSEDLDSDLAWIKIDATGLTPATLADPSAGTVGDPVIVIGNPLGLRNSVTMGIISGKGRSIDNTGYPFLQTDAAINFGNSGGPVVNSAGQVVGIAAAKYAGVGIEGIGFAIPVAVIAQSQAIASRSSKSRAYMGIMVSQSFAADMGEDTNEGVTVMFVAPSSPAEQAGLSRDDEIVKIDNQPIHSLADLRQVVDNVLPGTTVAVTIRRAGVEEQLSMTMGAVAMGQKRPFFNTEGLEPWEGVF